LGDLFAFSFHLALPDHEYSPTFPLKSRCDDFVSLAISLEFFTPVFGILDRYGSATARSMLMPETTMYKYRNALPCENDVGSSH
jgi:hypothetical protein